MASSDEVEMLFRMVTDVYPMAGAETPESIGRLCDIWKMVLSDQPVDLLKAAVIDYLNQGKEWRPVPGMIRQKALDIAGGSDEKPDLDARAVASWHQYKKARFASKTPTDPLVDIVSEMFDHQGFGMSNVEDESYWANMWIKLYIGVARQTERERRMSPEVKQARDELQAGERQKEVQDRIAETAKRLSAGNGRSHD